MTDREYQELLKAYDKLAPGAERDRLWAIINLRLTTTSKLTRPAQR